MQYSKIALTLLILTVTNLILIVNSEYIPPGPKYKCPKNAAVIYPCICTKSNDDGIFVTCENSNLASLSIAFINLASTNLPIEDLHMQKCKIRNLYGTLLHKVNAKRLFIIDTPMSKISDHVFYGINDTLKELHLINTKLNEFPTNAFKILSHLTVLNIDQHLIDKLPKNVFAEMTFDGVLEKLHITDGPLNDIGPDVFQHFRKLKTLDLHGNQLVALKKGQFKGLRETEIIDLSFNNLTKVDASHMADMTKLSWCNISNNALSEITRGTFARNSVLKLLNMGHNNIKKIDTNTFRGMRFLRRLFLNDNDIGDIGRGTFGSITRIGTIDLARNKIKKVEYQMFSQLNYAEVINLAENLITEIQKESFKDVYLTNINISFNRLETIEAKAFINCANITILDLSHNMIKNIPRTAFDETTYATEWILSYNMLTNMSQVPLLNMTGLKVLNVSYNSIEDIPKNTFPKLYELHTIDLSHNNLSKIYNAAFQNLFSLRLLNLSYNDMEKIGPSTFGNLPTLLEFDISNNKLKDVTKGAFAKLTGLRVMSISDNFLDKVFQIPISLNHISFKNNLISEIPERTWPTMNSLLTLDLSYNKLENNLKGGSFAGLLTLQKLNLESNGITLIPKEGLNNLNTLQYLYLKDNSITELPKGALGSLPILFELHLVNNGLKTVSERAFDGLLQLLTLNLSSNGLKQISNGGLASLVSLRKLDLSHNLITSIDNKTNGILDDCLSLHTIDLSHNRISFITKKTFPSNQYIPYSLKRINLSYNTISVVTHDLKFGTKTVEQLDLSHNNIKDIRVGVLGNLTSLRKLDLSNNELSRVENDVFKLPENCTHLDLSNNRIGNISYDSLLKLQNLTELNLKGNKIEDFDTGLALKMKSSNLSVYFEDNPLTCDCYTRPLYNYLKSLSKVPEFYMNLTCREPSNLDGRKLLELQDDHLHCIDQKNQTSIYKLLPDLRFREIAYFKGHLMVQWYVTATRDIADFYVYMRDSKNNIKFEKTVSYSTRILQIKGSDITTDPPNLEVCVLAKSSDDEIQFIESQCQKLPGNLAEVKEKYNESYNYKFPLGLTSNEPGKSGSDGLRLNLFILIAAMLFLKYRN